MPDQPGKPPTKSPVKTAAERSGPPRGLDGMEERWDFYRDEARHWREANKFNRWVIGGLMLAIVGVYYACQGKDHLFGISADGRVIAIPEIQERAVSDATVRRFCSESISEIGTFGFNDFTMRFGKNSGRFTPNGWHNYNDAVMAQRIPEAVRLNTQTYSTTPQGQCVIIDEKIVNGRFWWLVRADAFRRVTSGSKFQDFNLHIEMEIVRVGYSEADELIAIDRWKE